MRYIIEHFTQRPTFGPPDSSNPIDFPLLPFDEKKKPIAFKIHGENRNTQEQIAALLRHNVSLMFLVRNPMEVFPRHMGFEEITSLTSGLSPATISKGIAYFFENTRTYHSYKGKKQIFYYEDLAKKPEMFIKQLCEFLEIDADGTKQREFMRRFDYHFEASRQTYNRHQKQFLTRVEIFQIPSSLQICYHVGREELADLLKEFHCRPYFSMKCGNQHPDLEAAVFSWSSEAPSQISSLSSIKHSLKEWETHLPGFQMVGDLEVGWFQGNALRFPYEGVAPADYLRIWHGPAAAKQGKRVMLRIPVEETRDATQTDGKTAVKYSLNLSKKEQENFWDNFKTLCGSADWRPYERYMDIK